MTLKLLIDIIIILIKLIVINGNLGGINMRREITLKNLLSL